ncbi:MAG: peptidyl-prolyl cis-trans isomerase [bacterium]
MKKVFGLLFLLVFASGFPAIAGADESRGKGETSPLIRVGTRQVTRGQFREKLGKDFPLRHGMILDTPGPVVSAAVEGLVRDLLVASEIDNLSKTDHAYASLRVYLDDAIMGNHYMKKVLPKIVNITEEEIAAGAPKYSKEIRIRQLTVVSEQEAREARDRLLAGDDFVGLIRARSIDPGVLSDGLHVGYLRESDSRFSRDDIQHLYSLEKGQYSRVLPTPLGFSVCRVEEIVDIPDAERERKLAKIRERITAQRLREMMDAVRKEIVTVELNRESFSRPCQLYLQGDLEKGRTIVFAAADRELTLETVVFLVNQASAAADPGAIPDNTAKHVQRYFDRALSMSDLIISAFIARKAGYEVSAEDRSRISLFNDQQMSAFHYRRVFGSFTATDEEARKYYSENPEPFIGQGSVEMYDIYLGTKVAADKARKRIAAGEKFEDVAKKTSIDKESRKKGGYLGVKPLSTLAPEVAAVAHSLREGASSDTIQTRDGFHIIKVKRRIPAEVVPFDGNAKEFQRTYLAIKKRKALEEYLQPLAKKYPVDVDWNGVREIIKEKEKEGLKKKGGQ